MIKRVLFLFLSVYTHCPVPDYVRLLKEQFPGCSMHKVEDYSSGYSNEYGQRCTGVLSLLTLPFTVIAPAHFRVAGQLNLQMEIMFSENGYLCGYCPASTELCADVRITDSGVQTGIDFMLDFQHKPYFNGREYDYSTLIMFLKRVLPFVQQSINEFSNEDHFKEGALRTYPAHKIVQTEILDKEGIKISFFVHPWLLSDTLNSRKCEPGNYPINVSAPFTSGYIIASDYPIVSNLYTQQKCLEVRVKIEGIPFELGFPINPNLIENPIDLLQQNPKMVSVLPKEKNIQKKCFSSNHVLDPKRYLFELSLNNLPEEMTLEEFLACVAVPYLERVNSELYTQFSDLQQFYDFKVDDARLALTITPAPETAPKIQEWLARTKIIFVRAEKRLMINTKSSDLAKKAMDAQEHVGLQERIHMLATSQLSQLDDKELFYLTAKPYICRQPATCVELFYPDTEFYFYMDKVDLEAENTNVFRPILDQVGGKSLRDTLIMRGKYMSVVTLEGFNGTHVALEDSRRVLSEKYAVRACLKDPEARSKAMTYTVSDFVKALPEIMEAMKKAANYVGTDVVGDEHLHQAQMEVCGFNLELRVAHRLKKECL